MIEVHFLIPTHDNNQVRFRKARHLAFRDVLVRLFNGVTGPLPAVAGAWADAGRLYLDTNVSYFVVVGGLIESAARILEAVEFARANYSQEKIAVRYLGHLEIL